MDDVRVVTRGHLRERLLVVLEEVNLSGFFAVRAVDVVHPHVFRVVANPLERLEWPVRLRGGVELRTGAGCRRPGRSRRRAAPPPRPSSTRRRSELPRRRTPRAARRREPPGERDEPATIESLLLHPHTPSPLGDEPPRPSPSPPRRSLPGLSSPMADHEAVLRCPVERDLVSPTAACALPRRSAGERSAARRSRARRCTASASRGRRRR